MPLERVLVVDDEPNARGELQAALLGEGFETAGAASGQEALELIESFGPGAVLSDVRMPLMDGMTLMRRAKEASSDAVFVMMTGYGSVEMAVDAMRAGAESFLIKPLDVAAVAVVLQKALEKRRLGRETELLRLRVRERFQFDSIVGDSPQLQAVFDIVKRSAPTRATVLLLGESGTGKELIAQALHEASGRRDKPFIRVNCSALSASLLESELFGHEKGSFTGALARREGRFELANGGTLLLDEVGEMSPSLQVKLLRVLQSHEFERVGGTQTVKVDVRVVAATNRDLEAEVKAGRFREDLYYRLNVVAVTLPPLRTRKGDIPALVSHFVDKFSAAHGKAISGLAPGLLNALLRHSWPGNVRELENAIERAVVLSSTTELTADDLPSSLMGPRPLDPSLAAATTNLFELEREAILRTLESVDGSTARAAELLGISVRKIQYRLKEYSTGVRPVLALVDD